MAEGKDKGWISLYRAVKDGWLWEDKPFARGQAWIDLLLQANHKERKVLSKGELVTVKRGSFLTSDEKLADRWGWTRKKVRTYLDVLEKEQMVTLNRSPKGTSLSIVNWGLYQHQGTTEGTTEGQQKDNRGTTEGTTEGQQRDTNNNDNNYNNDNNEKNEENGKKEEPTTAPSIPSNPSKVESIILDNFGETCYKTWFVDCKIEEQDKLIKFKVPSEFKGNMITRKYKEPLEILTHKEIVIEVGD